MDDSSTWRFRCANASRHGMEILSFPSKWRSCNPRFNQFLPYLRVIIRLKHCPIRVKKKDQMHCSNCLVLLLRVKPIKACFTARILWEFLLGVLKNSPKLAGGPRWDLPGPIHRICKMSVDSTNNQLIIPVENSEIWLGAFSLISTCSRYNLEEFYRTWSLAKSPISSYLTLDEVNMGCNKIEPMKNRDLND